METKFEFDGVPLDKGGLGGFVLLNLYFPNGGERADGTEMLGYKLEFYKHFRHYINTLRKKGERVITCGDFNICHHEIDIARPKENVNSIGFLPIERIEMDKLEKDGYIDVFRHINPELADQYTWRSFRAGARQRNVGWRLDYFWVSEDVISQVQKIIHQNSVE
ncbi:endonuclease/exonuclease/phosphatase family protein [Patescibacteria group bacterium]|nr:endonuclease/exonuclease/phosphatase family protein [Patescibacteria group bacterium]MBU1627601.1 endonuclease/exonuclease/phosphatase family protein [bacterium]